eukprot:7019742-Pyramimonas_sp.AAC.1
MMTDCPKKGVLEDRNTFRGCTAEPNVCPFNDLPMPTLYTAEMDRLFQKYYALLECIYRRYKTKETFDLYRSQHMELHQWVALLSDAHIVGPRFTVRMAAQ